MADELTKAWAAGLFDGEGSALISKTGSNSYQIVVAVANTDERATDPIMELWGGHYRKNRDMSRYYKDGHRRVIDSTVYFDRSEAKKFLLDILPYLRVRQDKALIVLRAIYAQEKAITEKGLRGSSRVLRPFYEELTPFP